jgi:hypothetical protein
MTKATTIKNLAAYLPAILNPAPEKPDILLPAKCGLFYASDSPVARTAFGKAWMSIAG